MATNGKHYTEKFSVRSEAQVAEVQAELAESRRIPVSKWKQLQDENGRVTGYEYLHKDGNLLITVIG